MEREIQISSLKSLNQKGDCHEKISKTELDLRANVGYAFLLPALIIIFWLISPATIMAENRVTYQGTLQGASCVHYKKECPEDEAHIALEHDFVLLLQNGEHYFLPNLNRAIKARHVGQPVQVHGEQEDHEIWVEDLDVKKGNKYTNVWSWKKQRELYKGGGG